MLEDNNQMPEQNQRSALDNPRIKREGMVLNPSEPAAKSKAWVFKLILVLLIIVFILYLFTHPQIIQNFVNKYFNNILK